MSLLQGLFCLTASHKRNTSVENRERLALAPALMDPFLKSREILQPYPKSSFMYLSTCHRVEIYGWGVHPTELAESWCEAARADLSCLKIYREIAALEHFSRVAAGLESEIIGENQIMGQVRSAFRDNMQSALLSSPLTHILQRGLRIARAVRTESRIGEGRENIASLSIQSLGEFFESLADKKFLIVGAGSMALLALEKLRQLKATNITWINRTRATIEAHPYSSFCEIQDFSRLVELVENSDVTILATAATSPILHAASFQEAKKRRTRPRLRVILDLGLPRNAAAEMAECGFYLRNVDDFQNLLEKHDVLQNERVEFAERVLQREISLMVEALELDEIGKFKEEFLRHWKNFSMRALTQISVENSAKLGYDWDRFWAKLGHNMMTKANELGPLEGGQFLQHLSETLVKSLTPDETTPSKIVHLRESKLNKEKSL